MILVSEILSKQTHGLKFTFLQPPKAQRREIVSVTCQNQQETPPHHIDLSPLL